MLHSYHRLCAALLSAAIFLPFLPALPTAAEHTPALRIDKVEVPAETVPDSRIVSVDVMVEGNENGFLASEFGISYDERLTVDQVQLDTAAGKHFAYWDVPENHTIWFSGASASPENAATEGTERIFTLDLVLPEDWKAGDRYAIGYRWKDTADRPGFWYVGKGENAYASLMEHSTEGAVTIPDPQAARLSSTSLTLNPGEQATLSTENSTEEGIWFTDNSDVATVENGVITAVSAGTCTISVFLAGANSLLTCEVSVRSDYRYSMADPETITLHSPEQVVILEYPDAVGSVQWLSTDEDIVKVEDGRLTGLKNGNAQIIANSNGKALLKQVIVAFDEAPLAAGDLNGDASIDILDVITVNKFLLGGISLTDPQRECADVFHDKMLDTTDALTLLKFVVEIVPSLPVEP